LLVYQAYPVF